VFVLDNTVLSNFTAIEKMDTLVRILKEEAVVPEPVANEFHECKRFSGLEIGLPVVQITVEDLELFADSVRSLGFSGLGKGELSCIFTVSIENLADAILTDDNLARKYCSEYKIEFHGSVYILALGVRKKVYSLSEAEKLLSVMKRSGFWLKDRITVQDALRFFE
jgi:predicted nucleic acid-binding protein